MRKNVQSLFTSKLRAPLSGVLIVFLALSAGVMASGGLLVTITDKVQTEFGTYVPVFVRSVPSVVPYTVEAGLTNVINREDYNLTAEQIELIVQNGFVATPESSYDSGTGYNEIYDVYVEANSKGLPIFVTTDAVLHIYHRFFDDILQNIEEDQFLPSLIALDTSLFSRARQMDLDENDPSTFLLGAYFAVALSLADPSFEVPSDYSAIVAQELALIEAHEGYAASPLFGAYPEDYSQYKPRGHYTKSEALERYFKTMMWHGRMTFILRDGYGTVQPTLTGAALLLTQALSTGNHGEEWGGIYFPTTFFAGRADDLLYTDYLTVATRIYGSDFLTQAPDLILDPASLQTFITEAEASLPDPEIPTLTGKGLRFMGQRFIPDSLMFTRLVYPYVLDRYMPRSLDVMAVLGSDLSLEILEAEGETVYPGYMEEMKDLKERFSSYPEAQWADNLYWNWLYTLMPLLYPKGEGYPFFMQNGAWEKKDLNAALGSWTELRHDTILYAKQSTSGTGMPPEYFPTPGYVEPNADLYARLAALTRYTMDGLTGFSLLDTDTEQRLRGFEAILLELKTIAEKELANRPPNHKEQAWLSTFGDTIRNLVTTSDYPDDSSPVVGDDPMAIIADVHTDPNSSTCLEEAVGFPYRLLVAVPVSGQVLLTVGASFSYYEFSWPISDRLTDEAWRDMLKEDPPPDPPAWTNAFRDSSTLSNPNPTHVWSGASFVDVDVTVEVNQAEELLVLTLTIPYEQIESIGGTINGADLNLADASSHGEGTVMTFHLPEGFYDLEDGAFTLSISTIYGAHFTWLTDLKSDFHSRPFSSP